MNCGRDARGPREFVSFLSEAKSLNFYHRRFSFSSMSSERIAFVGVGRMGANMARRLKDCGYAVTAVYDVHSAAADGLANEIAAQSARTLAEATASGDVIFTVVTDDAAQLGVFAERGDSLLIGAKGKTFVNCATITPATHVEVERRAKAAG